MKELSLLHIVLFYLAVINMVTFFVYGIDKRKAVSQREQSQTCLNSAERKQLRPKVKAVSQREQSQTCLNSAERKQLRPQVKAKKSKVAYKRDCIIGLGCTWWKYRSFVRNEGLASKDLA